MPKVVLENLTRVVDGETHLDGIDLELSSGEFHVVLGRTRAGKTTLLRQIAGLDRPTSGRVLHEGASADEARRRVAMVYQEFVNYPSLTVFENIASPLRARGRVHRDEIERRVRDVAARLHLEDLLDRRPSELSGGQQQRTALARALVKEADVVLLDEPLANLDYKLREELRAEVRRVFSGRDAVVVFTTTDPAEALWFGGRVAVLHEGRLLQEGVAREVYDTPADERVAAIVSDPPMNLWDVELVDGRVRLSEGLTFAPPEHLSSLAPGRWRLGARAHELGLSARSGSDVRIPAELELAEVNGSETLLHARHGSTPLLARAGGVHALPPGLSLDLFLDPSATFAFHPTGGLAAAPTGSLAGAPDGTD